MRRHRPQVAIRASDLFSTSAFLADSSRSHTGRSVAEGEIDGTRPEPRELGTSRGSCRHMRMPRLAGYLYDGEETAREHYAHSRG